MEKMSRSLIFYIILLCAGAQATHCQPLPQLNDNPLTLADYLASVIKGNLGYIAGQFNVSIAEAELKASAIMPDPELSVSYTNNEERRLMMGQSVEGGISYPLNLGNPRRAGMNLARSQYELSGLMLEAYFQELRAQASLVYFDLLRSREIYITQTEIQQQLAELARADSLRYINGEVAALDALQSSLEARTQQTEADQSLADMQNALIRLMYFRGAVAADMQENLSDSFPVRDRSFDIGFLINNAIEQRSDLLAALKNREVSEKYLKLIKAGRAPEVNLETGYSYNSIVRNETAPAPAFRGLSAGVTFPLKFSSLNKGSLMAADLAVKQSEIIYEETELQIRQEVLGAYNNFTAQERRIRRYNQGLVGDAEEILKGRIYAYRRGESSLIELLNAQRTYYELKVGYINALYDYTASLIDLERSAAIWDLTL